MDADEYSDNAANAPCSTCGRTFRPDVLAKHAPICRKTAQKKRRVFESGKQRAAGTEIPVTKVLKVNQPPPKDSAKVEAAANRKHNWRQRHEDFIRNIRAAKQYQHAAATGGPLPPPPPATIDPSFILCDYCGRRFNEKAAERHIPFCREKNARISGPGGGGGFGGGTKSTGMTTKTNQYNTSDAHQKMAVRTQYQPPKPRVAAAPAAAATTAGRVPSGGAPLRTGKTVKDYMDARELAAESRGSSGGGSRTSARGGGGGGAGSGPARYGAAGGGGGGGAAAARYGGGGGGASGGPQRYGAAAAGPANGSGYGRGAPAARGGGGGGPPSAGGGSNFCHECGNKYPTGAAKFCVQCGCKRMTVS